MKGIIMRVAILTLSLPHGRKQVFRLVPRDTLPLSIQIENKIAAFARIRGVSTLAVDEDIRWSRAA
jgi:hypothetical protein